MRTTPRRAALLASAVLLLGLVGIARASHLLPGQPATLGHTTVDQTITGPNPNAGYADLMLGAGDPYAVRDAGENATALPPAPANRADVRQSLAYVAQFTDFQLADEESPARVEFVDPGASSAHRPQEALTGFEVDYSIQQVNEFADESPVDQGGPAGGSTMDFALVTGDNADSNQRNETVWIRELLEGGSPINFNSGSTDPSLYNAPAEDLLPGCALADPDGTTTPGVPLDDLDPEGPGIYTGVQDYDDYTPHPAVPLYYDPDEPTGQYEDWPMYTGLMDRAQALTFTPAGLDVPSYVTNGNHDVLVQGNEDAIQEFERIAIGCEKILASTGQPSPGIADPNVLLDPPSATMTVARDPERRFVSRPQIREIFSGEDNDHGFGFVDPAQRTASTHPAYPAPNQFAASYYAWDPEDVDPAMAPGFRFISIDTNSEGGQTAEGVGCGSSNGNIDDPQFQWLKSQLQAAQDADKLIVLFGHHPVRSMCSEVPDENAAPCTTTDNPAGTHPQDTPPHDVNPGCDLDPRVSDPIHVGQDPQPGDPRESFVELLNQFPNVITYVAGHTHDNNLDLFSRTGANAGTAWWSIETSAVADWPTQSRLIEVMDNRNDTLSIFGTLIDHGSDATAPADGPAGGFDANQLSSIGRTLAYNDPQAGNGTGEGADHDQNAELLLHDPRESDLVVTKSDDPGGVDAPPEPDSSVAGQNLTYTIKVTNNDPASDAWSAQNVVLTDDLPTTADFVGVDVIGQGPPEPCNAPTGEEDLVCQLGNIAPQQTVTVEVTVNPQTAGEITNTATATSIFNDPTAANATASETTSITPNPAINADLELVSKTASPSPVTAGDPLTYSILVRNNGPDADPGVAVTDQLPGGVILSSATTPGGSCETDLGVVTCELGSLADAATTTVTIVVVPQAAGTLDNNASVSGQGIDATPGNNSKSATTQVMPRPTPSAGSAARQGSCRLRTATIVGTPAGETITGTAARDVIAAGDGNDTVLGVQGKDLLCGEAGDDELLGGKGPDLLIGGPGDDLLRGGKGRDRGKGKGGSDDCRSTVKQSSCR